MQARQFRYCPQCASALVAVGGTGRPECPRCGYVHYLNPIAVVAGILLSDGPRLPPEGVGVPPARASHVLLVRRSGTRRGSWCLPCGYIDHGEEVRDAVRREIREETGLVVGVGEVFAVHSNFHDPDQPSAGIWFLVRYLEGRLCPGDDADRATFRSLSEIRVPLAFPTDRMVLEALAGRIRC